MDSGELHVDNIDVFCEKGVFELSDTKKILDAGKDIGLKINFHAEELNQLNSVEVCYMIIMLRSAVNIASSPLS